MHDLFGDKVIRVVKWRVGGQQAWGHWSRKFYGFGSIEIMLV